MKNITSGSHDVRKDREGKLTHKPKRQGTHSSLSFFA